MKKAVIIAVVMAVMVVAGCGQIEPVPDEKTVSRKSDRTIVTPHMRVKIDKYKNVIYCSTFQIAWNMFKNKILKGEDIKLEGQPDTAVFLNKGVGSRSDISEKDYIALAGTKEDNIVRRINKMLAEKFPYEKPVTIELFKEDVLLYAYLHKNLKFKNVFHIYDDVMTFNTEKEEGDIESFGIYRPENEDALKEQAEILYVSYADEGKHGKYVASSVILELKTKDPDDRLILACIEPKETLLKTVENAEQLIKDFKPEYRDQKKFSDLRIPKFDLDIKKEYDEFKGKKFMNPALSLQGWYIREATQSIKFRLDEKGALLSSFVMFIAPMGLLPPDIVFNRPFLIYIKEDKGKHPYFAMWVGNSDLMVKRKSIPALMEMLSSDNETEWKNAAEMLARKSAEAAPFLEKALSDKALCLKAINVIYRINELFLLDKAGWTGGMKGDLKKDIPNYKRIIQKLEHCLNDKDVSVQVKAAFTLNEIAPKKKLDLSSLKKRLNDKDISIRVKAEFALAELEPHRKLDLDVVIEGLEHGNDKIRLFILDEIFYIVKWKYCTIPYAKRDDEYILSGFSMSKSRLPELGLIWKGKCRIEQIIKGTDDFSEQLIKISLTDKGKELNKGIETVFRQGNREVRKRILSIFAEMPVFSGGGDIVKELFRTSEDEWTRRKAGVILWKRYRDRKGLLYQIKDHYMKDDHSLDLDLIFSDRKEALPYLARLLKDKDRKVRGHAASALGGLYNATCELPAPPREAIDALIAMVNNQNDDDLRSALYALEVLGSHAKPGVPALMDFARKNKDYLSFDMVRDTLSHIDAYAEAILILEFNKKNLRNEAEKAFDNLKGFDSPDAVPLLIGLMDHKDRTIRYAAIKSLGGIGPGADKALSALITKMRDGSELSRLYAAQALLKIAPHNNEVKAALFAALKTDLSREVRTGITSGLREVAPPYKGFIPILIYALDDNSIEVRQGAGRSLIKIADRSVLPALKEVLRRSRDDKIIEELEELIRTLEKGKEDKDTNINWK